MTCSEIFVEPAVTPPDSTRMSSTTRQRSPMAKRMVLMLIGTGILFGGIFFMKYMGAKGMNAYFDSMPTPPATISTGQVQQMKWDNVIDAPGSFVAVNGTNVTTEAAGIVKGIHFESGGHVATGAL